VSAPAANTPAIRVLLVDDHPVVRRGMRHLLGTYGDMLVVGEAGDGPAALQSAGQLAPDVILLDIRLPDISGFELAAQLREAAPASRVIMLTTYDDDEYLARALGGGAHGYLLKSASDESVAEAIRAVHRGERVITPALTSKVLGQFETLSRIQSRLVSQMGDDEVQILRLIKEGATNKQIARQMFLSERTVKRRVQDLLRKLNVPTRAQAVIEATKRGLL
jgi:DNA-binding NarL/FixJ family response regulator